MRNLNIPNTDPQYWENLNLHLATETAKNIRLQSKKVRIAELKEQLKLLKQ